MIIATIGHQDFVLDSMDDAKLLADIISRSKKKDHEQIQHPEKGFQAIRFVSAEPVELEIKITSEKLLGHDEAQEKIAALRAEAKAAKDAMQEAGEGAES